MFKRLTKIILLYPQRLIKILLLCLQRLIEILLLCSQGMAAYCRVFKRLIRMIRSIVTTLNNLSVSSLCL